MKRFLFLMVCIVFSFEMHAQYVESEQCLGGNDNEHIRYIEKMPDGGKILIIETLSTNGTFSDTHGLTDVALVRLNNQNQVEWEKAIDDSLHNDYYKFMMLFEGNIYLITQSDIAADSINTASSELMLTAMDLSGNIRWKNRFSKKYDAAAADIHYFNLQTDSLFHNVYLIYYDDWTEHVQKFHADGMVWDRTYDFSGYVLNGYYGKYLSAMPYFLPDESIIWIQSLSSQTVLAWLFGTTIITKTNAAGDEVQRNDTLSSGYIYQNYYNVLVKRSSADSIYITSYPFTEVAINKNNLAFVARGTPFPAGQPLYEYYIASPPYSYFGTQSNIGELLKMGYFINEEVSGSSPAGYDVILLYNIQNEEKDTILKRDSLSELAFYFDPVDSSLYFLTYKYTHTHLQLLKYQLGHGIIYSKEVYNDDNAAIDYNGSKLSFYGSLSNGKLVENFGTEYYQVIQVYNTQTGDVEFEYKNNKYDNRQYNYFECGPGNKGFAIAGLNGIHTCRLGGDDIIFQNVQLNSNSISGAAYIDYNNNNQYDGGDVVYNLSTLESKKGSETISNFMYGNVYTKNSVDTGTWETKINLTHNYFSISPSSKITSHADFNNADTATFILHPLGTIHDLGVNLINPYYTPLGGATHYEITYVNNGTNTESCDVRLVLDPRLSVDFAIPVPSSQNGDTLTWHFTNLSANAFGKISVSSITAIPPALNYGDALTSVATVTGMYADTVPADNQSTLIDSVRSSYDPNDKVSTNGDDMTTTQIQNGDYITYVVRFQNTGNDTAFKVVILDTLSANVDWSTFQMVNASHNFSVQILNQHILQFTSNNIKLPPTSINEDASHGFVAYKVKPKSTLTPGDTIKNTAHIYFDYNAPVATGTVNTRITLLTRVPEIPKNNSVKIYPNPNNGRFTIEFTGSEPLQSISIFDLSGRKILEKKIASGKTIPVNMENFASGIYTIELKTATDRYIQKILLTE